MCGIAGIQMIDGSPPLKAELDGLASALAHRGPDGQGQHIRDNLGMVQVRLAIIDLAGGDQPFYESEDKPGIALIANGEIYNYLELRESMKDSNFVTNSDCELPLHLYRQHGLDFVKHLRGMYTIAIDDSEQNQLVLARDPFGIKPLYYVESDRGFVFASEAQALIGVGFVKAEIVPEKRDELLQLQFPLLVILQVLQP